MIKNDLINKTNITDAPCKNLTVSEIYYPGKINAFYNYEEKPKIFMGQAHKSKIPSGDMMKETIINNINLKKDMIILGYGQSGSGKTSTLIHYLNTTKGQEKDIPGLLPTVLNNLNAAEYTKLELTYIDMYMNWDTISSAAEITRNHYKLYKMGDDAEQFIREHIQNNWVSSKSNKSLGRSILEAFDAREIEPTENNPNSSRSHVLIHIKVFNSRGDVQCNIVIGDLAGVENKFTCSPSSIINLDQIYITKSDKYKVKPGTNQAKNEIYYDALITTDTTNDQQLEILKNKKEKGIDTITEERTKSILTCLNVIRQFEKLYNNRDVTEDDTEDVTEEDSKKKKEKNQKKKKMREESKSTEEVRRK